MDYFFFDVTIQERFEIAPYSAPELEEVYSRSWMILGLFDFSVKKTGYDFLFFHCVRAFFLEAPTLHFSELIFLRQLLKSLHQPIVGKCRA